MQLNTKIDCAYLICLFFNTLIAKMKWLEPEN